MAYESPGDAFSSGLNQYYAQQQLLEQQALQNRLAVQREQRMAQHDAMEMEQAKAALAEKRQMFDETQKEKKKAAFEKTVGEMLPGDVPTPELVQQAKEFGLTHLFPGAAVATEPQLPEAPVGIISPEAEATPMAPAATGTVRPPLMGGFRFAGTAKQRQEAQDDAALLDIASKLPEGAPERLQLEALARVKKTIPAGTFKSSTGVPLMRQNAAKGVVERMVDGEWVPQTGDVPQGSHFMTEPQPKDNSANADRDERRMDTSYERGITELNNLAKVHEASVHEYDKLGAMLNQKTAQADADLAPLVLKATVGGMGSGFRMTRAEIDNTLHGRTKWEDLEAVLRKWSTSPQTMTIPDSQREAIRSLAVAIRKKGYDLLTKINHARVEFDDARDAGKPERMRQIRTKLRSDMYQEDSEDLKPAVTPTTNPADLIKQIRGGK